MPTLKIALFDAEELKALEDTLARAMLRAIRVALKEGMVNGYKPPEPEAEPAAVPAFGMRVSGGNAAPVEPVKPIVADNLPSPKKHRQKNRHITDVAQIVEGRVPGFIPSEDALSLIGVSDPAYAAQLLRSWVFGKEVEAVIQQGAKVTPTKGLPGKLMIHKLQLTQRNELRKRNAALPTRERMALGQTDTPNS